MCIISEPVEEVSETKILVGVNSDFTKQITVYSNDVENYSESNAMILPVPNPQSVKFIDLTNYSRIFNDADSVFELEKSRSLSKSLSRNYSLGINSLEIHNVGSYKASIALGLEDLKRVNKSVFNLSSGCYDLLKRDYSNPKFGFIICKLNKGKESYHPFAYSHNLLSMEEIFIPTKHYHEHNSNKKPIRHTTYTADNINDSPMFSNVSLYSGNRGVSFGTYEYINSNNSVTTTEDWAHEIYLYNVSANDTWDEINMNSTYVWNGKNPLELKKIDFNLGVLTCFEKYKITGRQKNIDLYGKVCTKKYNN